MKAGNQGAERGAAGGRRAAAQWPARSAAVSHAVRARIARSSQRDQFSM